MKFLLHRPIYKKLFKQSIAHLYKVIKFGIKRNPNFFIENKIFTLNVNNKKKTNVYTNRKTPQKKIDLSQI